MASEKMQIDMMMTSD